MEIRKTTPGDLDDILGIYKYAREFMRRNGNLSQWVNGYPARDLLLEDIRRGIGYVCEDGGRIAAVFVLLEDPEPTYAEIFDGAWLDDGPYGTVHRIAAAEGTRGAATFCLRWCLARCGNVRIDTHRDNVPMQSLLAKLDFTYCGRIFLENGGERLAYQRRETGGDTDGRLGKQEVYALLDRKKIPYTRLEHPAAYTVEDIDGFGLPDGERIVKNLFLRDDKKRQYYLVVLPKDKSANLKELRRVLDSRPLQFASEEDLYATLGVQKGAVTPLGILNDRERRTRVVLDRELENYPVLGVHPNENTATVWLSPADLLELLREHGSPVGFEVL